MNTEERELLVGVARVIQDMASSPDVYPLIAKYVAVAFPTVDRLSALIDRVAESEILPPVEGRSHAYSEKELFGTTETTPKGMPPRFEALKFQVTKAEESAKAGE